MVFPIRTPGVAMFVVMAGLLGCGGGPSLDGAERVVLTSQPFSGFVENEEKAARWLAYDLRDVPDKTLSNPSLTLQDFSQFEWTANAMKGVYIHVSPAKQRDLMEARSDIRTAMNVPRDASVAEAIRNYAARANSVSDADRRLISERAPVLRAAMVKAGRVFDAYVDSLDDSVKEIVE